MNARNKDVNIESTTQTIKKASPWLIGWGIVVFVCGILAIILPITFSVTITVVIGCLALVAGFGHLFSHFTPAAWADFSGRF